MAERLTIIHLEMTDPGQLNRRPPPEGLSVQVVGEPLPALNRFFYQEVGGPWRWQQRLVWSDQQWADYVCRDELVTIVGYYEGTPVGFCELEAQLGGNVEIRYFGLLPQFIGRRFGGALLTAGVETAWAIEGTQRVWVHTCTLDHPAALSNYKARGFRVFKEEQV